MNYDSLIHLMKPRIRESVQNMCASFGKARFLTEYLVRDPMFWYVLKENTSSDDWETEYVCVDWDQESGSWAFHLGERDVIELTESESCLIEQVFDQGFDAWCDHVTAISIVEALIEARMKEEQEEK